MIRSEGLATRTKLLLLADTDFQLKFEALSIDVRPLTWLKTLAGGTHSTFAMSTLLLHFLPGKQHKTTSLLVDDSWNN